MYLYMQVDGLVAPPESWDAGDVLNLSVIVRHMVRIEYAFNIGQQVSAIFHT